MQHDSCSIQSYIEAKANFYIIFQKEFVPLAEETVIEFVPILYMLGFGLVAAIPALIISRLLSPRRRLNPIKFLPME